MFDELVFFFFFSSRRRHTRCALVTGVQTCALPIFARSKPLGEEGGEAMLESAGRLRRRVIGVAAGLALLMATPAAAAPDLVLPWPESGEDAGPAGERVTFASQRHFAHSNGGHGSGEEEARASHATRTRFPPPGDPPPG